MGLDGGTIISRSDVLRGSSWRMSQADTSRSTRGGTVSNSNVYQEQQLDQQTQKEVAWGSCALSGQPLKAPVVADPAGQLLNKDAALELLLGRKGAFADAAAEHRYANLLRSSGAGAWDHVTSLRDLVTVQLPPPAATQGTTTAPLNGSSGSSAAGPSSSSSGMAGSAQQQQQQVSPSDWVCPVTLLPCMHHPSSLLKPCGHVISNKALAAITASTTSAAAASAAAAAGSSCLDVKQPPLKQQQQQQQRHRPQEQEQQEQKQQQQQHPQHAQEQQLSEQEQSERQQGNPQRQQPVLKVGCMKDGGGSDKPLALVPYSPPQLSEPVSQTVNIDHNRLDSVASSMNVCPVCSTPFTASQVLLLNGSAQQRQQMRQQHLEQVASSKKGKKRARTPQGE